VQTNLPALTFLLLGIDFKYAFLAAAKQAVNYFTGGKYECSYAQSVAVCGDLYVSLDICPADARVVNNDSLDGDQVCDYRRRNVAADDKILGETVPYKFCFGCSDRDYDGISVWLELG
jgi:hypothetical protein